MADDDRLEQLATPSADAVGNATVPDASHEPDRPVSTGWLWLFALIWFGFWLLIMLPGQFMVAKLSAFVEPDEKVFVTSFLITEMSLVVLVTVPVIGVLCDRTRVRFGRRRVWALGGFIVACAPFALTGTLTSWPLIAVVLGVVAIGEAAVLVSLSAMIADQVPRLQRGRASAAMGVPQVVALAVGMVLVTMLVSSIPGSWALVAALAMASALPFLLRYREPFVPMPATNEPATNGPATNGPATNEPATNGAAAFGKGFRRSLRMPRAATHPGYYWAMTSRVLINAGNLVGTTYLLFFITDVLKKSDPDTALLILILIYLGACALTSYFGGILSDRWKRRRVFVGVSAGLQGAAALLLAIAPTWNAALVSAVLLGLGFGLFLSVDQALITDLLPDYATRARDLGIINSAQHIPIAPLIGWLVLSISGYQSLYIVAAVIIMLGGFAVYRIKTVR